MLIRTGAFLLCLLPTLAFGQITYDSNEGVNTVSTNKFNDATEDLTWAGAPAASGRIVHCWAAILSNAVTFNTPTATNVTFTDSVTVQRVGLTLTLWRGNTTGTAGTTVTFTTSGNNSSNAQMGCFSFTPSNTLVGYDTAESFSEVDPAGTDHDTDVSVTTSGLSASRGAVVVMVSWLTTVATTYTIDADFTALTGTATIALVGYRILATGETTTLSNTSSPGRVSGSVMMATTEDAAAVSATRRRLTTLGVGR